VGVDRGGLGVRVASLPAHSGSSRESTTATTSALVTEPLSSASAAGHDAAISGSKTA
jgi:hypothetical protein